MEINVVNKEDKMLEIELVGEDHTLCNTIRKELWNDSEVTFSGYEVEHSLVANPKLVIKTKSKKPESVLQGAIDRLKKRNKEISDKVKSLKL